VKDYKKRLLNNFISLASLQGITFLLPLLTMPYLFRTLGPDIYGLVSFATATVFFFNIFVEYGFNLYATREISRNINDNNKINEIFSLILSTKLFLLFVSFVILTVVIFIFSKFSDNKLLFYLTFLLVIGNSLFPMWFFQGIEEMKYISIFTIVAKLIFTIGIFLFIKSSDDYLYQPFFNGIGMILISIYSLYFIRMKYNISFKFTRFTNILFVLKDSFNLFISDFMPNIYNNFSTFLLGFFTSFENLGYFSLATQIIDVFNKFIYIIRNVTYPFLNKDFSKFKEITIIFIITGFVFSSSILLGSNYILPYIFGEKVYMSMNIIYILSLSPLLFSITLSFGSNKLVVLNKDKIYRNIIIKNSLIGFIGSLVLIPIIGIYGAAINIIFTRMLLSIFTYNKSRGVSYDII